VALVVTPLLAWGVLAATPALAATPTVKAFDAAVTEANVTRTVNVKVQLSTAPTTRTTVDFTTVNGTATAPADYVAKSGTVVFPRGVRTKLVPIRIVGDALDEARETFKLRLSNPFRTRIADPVAVVTIVDNDPRPSLRARDVAMDEGDAGATMMSVPVTLSAPSGQRVSVAYTVTPGSATHNDDYTVSPTTGTLVFPPGSVSRSVSVAVLGDTVDEGTETLNVVLVAPVNASIADASGVATIRDDDGPGLRVNNVSAREGGTMVFTVSLSATSPQEVAVNYATSNGTAFAPSDYSARTGTLTFPPGTTSRTVSVPTAVDAVAENDEYLWLRLTSPVNAEIADQWGIGYIDDNGTLAKATPLPSIRGDQGSDRVTVSQAVEAPGDQDYYAITVRESISGIFDDDMSVRFTLAGMSSDLDLCIYTTGGALVRCSTAGGTATDVVAFGWDDSNGTDTRTYVARVFGVGSNTSGYTLTVTR
jgi:chitinase